MAPLLELFRRSLPDVNGVLLRQLAGNHLDVAHAQGRRLEDHLRGTQRILAAWGQSTILQRAGLCHSLYSTDAFAHRSIPLAERGRVQLAIGKPSEELVFLFCAIPRTALFRAVVRAVSLDPAETFAIEARNGFKMAGPSISGGQAQSLLLVHIANAAEQSGGRDQRPTVWLDPFQRMVRLLADKAPERVPPVLRELESIGRYAEREALSYYLQAIRLGNAETAIASMEKVASLLPPFADPHVWLASFAAQRGDESSRRHHARIARDKLLALGVAWDRRLTFDDWLTVARNAEKSICPADAFASLQGLTVEKAAPGESPEGTLPNGSCSRFESYLSGVAEAKSRKISAFYPGLREDAFWPSDTFQLAAVLKERFASIQQEIDSLDEEAFHDEAEKIQRSGKWQVFMLLEAGRWQEDNLKRLPLLARILKESDELRLAGGLAYLSRLAPGAIIAPHTGPTNMRLRLHFGIRVPTGDCALRVAGSERAWLEGESIVFNDFLQHEVWNRTQGERLILLIDVWHPDLTVKERRMLDAIHWMAEQHARGLFDYWKKNELARTARSLDQAPPPTSLDDLVL